MAIIKANIADWEDIFLDTSIMLLARWFMSVGRFTFAIKQR